MKNKNGGIPLVSISEPKLTKAEVKKTLDMVDRQIPVSALKEHTKSISYARQQIHFSGNSDVKVIKKRNVFDKVTTSTKKLTKQQIQEKQKAKQAFKGQSLMAHFRHAYEGLLDAALKLSIEEATIENMKKLIENLLERVKNSINDSKVTIKHVIGMDAEILQKVIVSLSFLVAGICFCGAFSNVSMFVKFILGAAASMAAMYPFLSNIRDYMMGQASIALVGKDIFETIRNIELPTEDEEAEMQAYIASIHARDAARKEKEISENRSFFSKICGNVMERLVEYEGLMEDFAPMIHMLCEFIASVAGIITGFCFTGDVSKIVRSITTSAKTRTDLQCIINEALKWVSGHIDSVAGTSFRDMFAQNAELENWGDSVHQMYIEYSKGTLELVPTNSQRVNSLTIRGGEIARKQMTMSAGAWAYHRYCSSMLAKMEAQFNSSGMPAEERQIPLCVCFRGASGVGKSYITNAFIDQLAMRVLQGERREQYVHDHAKEKWLFLPEEDHANGYNGQFATIIDDMGQFLTQKGQKDDMQQIIRWCNAAPCRLNAAELEKKGSLVFNSPLVMASTNLYQYWSPSLALPEAFVRRFDIWVDVTPKVEFCTVETQNLQPSDRRLDRNKIPTALELNLCEYRLLKVVDAAQQHFALDKILDFQGLVALMVEKFERNKNSHEALMKCLRVERERLFKEMTGDDVPHYEGLVEKVKEFFFSSRNFVTTEYEKVKSAFLAKVTEYAAHGYILKHKKEFTILAAIVVAIVGIFVLFKAINWFKRTFFAKKSVFHVDYEAELMSDKRQPILYGNMLIKSILERNVYHMYRQKDDPEKEESFGTMTMIKGRIGMINAHYIPQIKIVMGKCYDTHIKLVRHGNLKVTYSIPLTRFVDPEHTVIDIDSDVALVDVGEVVPVCRDIVPFFSTGETHEQNRDFDTILVAARSPMSLHTYRIKDSLVSQPLNVCGNIHNDVIIYEADTHTGDCGSLIFYSGSFANNTERIVGMHMAGVQSHGPKKGYASVLTQAKLNGFLSQMEVGPVREFQPVPEGDVLKNEKSSHETVRKAEKPVFQPTKTAIVPSVLYNELHPVTKAPAHLSSFINDDGVKVSPLLKAHKKQDSQNVSVDEKKLDIVKKEVLRELQQYMRHTGTKLTFDEAIVGRSDLPCLGPIPRKTSAGYSYYGNPEVKAGKKEFFGTEGSYKLEGKMYEDLKAKVEKLEEQMRAHIVPEDRVYMDILKDETLPLSKVAIGKTRMISACDLPMSIIYRKYFGPVCNDLVASRLLNGMAIGMNPYSDEWQFLSILLKAKGDKVVAGDFGSYDNSQTCQLIQAVVWIMSELSSLRTESDKKVLDCLAVTLSQPYHVSGSNIYELDHGMPSGNPMTSIMNSIFGLIVFRLCWGELMSARFVTYTGCIRGFSEYVKLVMYGDDNLLNISDEAIDLFNQTTMMATFPKFGLTYTSDEKEDKNPPPFRTIDKVTFLKRSFIWNDVLGRYVAGLDIPTIYNMLHYTKKGGSSESITIDNCYNALRESSLHGKIFFEYMVRRLTPLVKEKLNHHMIVDDYDTTILETVGYKPSWIREHI